MRSAVMPRGNQELLGCRGTAVAQSQIILRGAALVAVSFKTTFTCELEFRNLAVAERAIAGVSTNVRFVIVEKRRL